VSSRRERPSNTKWLGAVAAAAAIGAVAWLVVPRLATPIQVASVVRVEGPVQLRHGDDGDWQSLAVGTLVRDTDIVRTAAGSRVALRRADGLEIRVDAGTALTFSGLDTATLDAGRIYVDAGAANGHADRFTVATALGDVRHLGTQYSVALAPEGLNVAVREGSVAIDGRSSASLVAHAGERLTLATDGHVARGSVAPQDPSWRWAQAIAPAFEIDGRSLDAFLTWAARESGRQLVYDSAAAAHTAEELQLKGSVAGMEPEAAVAAVMATAPSLQHRFAGTQLRIEPATD
jgi:ferric-dicitrate binding protein FerR (iron transport regulator)